MTSPWHEMQTVHFRTQANRVPLLLPSSKPCTLTACQQFPPIHQSRSNILILSWLQPSSRPPCAKLELWTSTTAHRVTTEPCLLTLINKHSFRDPSYSQWSPLQLWRHWESNLPSVLLAYCYLVTSWPTWKPALILGTCNSYFSPLQVSLPSIPACKLDQHSYM